MRALSPCSAGGSARVPASRRQRPGEPAHRHAYRHLGAV